MAPAAERRHRGARVGLAALLAGLAACGTGRGVTPIHTPFNRGVYHHSRGELAAAIAAYRDALAEDPGDVRARFNLAAAHDQQGQELGEAGDAEAARAAFGFAEREYRRVLQDQPGNVRAEVNLAALEHERGEVAAARTRLEAAIAANDELALPRTALALRLLAAGETDAARGQLEAALQREPTDLGANLLLGRLHAEQGRVEAARDAYRAALRSEPDDPGALLGLACVEAAADRAGEAVALVDRVLLHDGGNLEAHLLAADLHEHQGALEDAVFHCWRARDLDRRRPARRDYQARLRELYARLLAAPPRAEGR
ncbi:MAG TPA: tetratricopeptide repeat protein [Planctomycetota bacterium]